MARVFISYSRTDRIKAAALAAALEDYGHEVWWDSHLVGGDDFQDVIEEKLSRVDATVVLWTTSSIKKDWVMAEARLADSRKILVAARYTKKVIPPAEFGHLHAEYLGDWNGAKRAPEMEKLNLRIAELKTAGDIDKLSAALGPKLKVHVEKNRLIRVLFDTALPGGLRISRFVTAAVFSSLGLWLVLFGGKVLFGGGDDAPSLVGWSVGLFLALAGARLLDQLILVSKGHSCDRFYDKAFSFSLAVSVLSAMIATLAWELWTRANGAGEANLYEFLRDVAAVSAGFLVMGYVARMAITLSKGLSHRI